MSTSSISFLNYDYYDNETKNNLFNNERPIKTSPIENIPTLQGDSLDHGKIHHHSKNATNGTITFPLKAKIMKNKTVKGFSNNDVTLGNNFNKGSLLFCLNENENNNNDSIRLKKEEDDICTIVDLETLNFLLVIHYTKKENQEKENAPYWKQWNFVGYLRNELKQTAKSKGYRLLNVDVSGATQTKNYWNNTHNNDQVVIQQQGTKLFLVLQKQWIRNAGKHIYQWVPIIGYPSFVNSNRGEKETILHVGSVLGNKHNDENFIQIFF